MVAVLAYRKRCAVAIPAVIMLQAASRRMNKLLGYFSSEFGAALAVARHLSSASVAAATAATAGIRRS